MIDRLEYLNMLVGGDWQDHVGYYQLVGRHVSGVQKIDPKQWRGWPALVLTAEGYCYKGVW